MNTAILALALTGSLLASELTARSPRWEDGYVQAQRRSASSQKPIAIFVGHGPNGWKEVFERGEPTAQVSELLTKEYVCVYLDTTNSLDRRMAQDLAIVGKPGVVLSSRGGDAQSFWHAGKLTDEGVSRYLAKFADPQAVVGATETADRSAVFVADEQPASVRSEPLPAPIQPIKSAPAPTVPPEPVKSVNAPLWRESYSDAQQASVKEQKPIAMFFGSGANGWSQVVRSNAPSAEITGVLKDKFVCLYVDTNTAYGKQLAGNFEISTNVGMVLSDRGGNSQAFWHQGELSNESAASYLTRHSNPQASIGGTETANTIRASYYQPQQQFQQQFMSAPAPRIMSSGSC